MDKHRNGKILILLFTGVLMGALDISIVGPAIPSIEKSIQVDHKSLAWIFSIYVLFNLIGVSLLARLSDLYGRKSIYVFSVAVFAIGSAMVAFSGNMTLLLSGRAVQGFGASGIFPVASAVIGDIFPPEKRGKALGMIGAVFGMAFLIGPLMAGVMLRFFSWNSLFLINIPIAIVVIYFSLRMLPSHKSNAVNFDWPGMLLIAILLASFVYGINSIDVARGLSSLVSIEVWPFFVISVISFILFIFFEKKAFAPVMKIELFDVKQIRIVGIVAVGAGLLQSVTIFVPEMAVNLFQVSSSDAAFMLIPFVLAVAVGAPVSGRLIDKVGSRVIVIAGLFSSATGLLVLFFASHSLPWFYAGGILIGLGTSMLQGSSMRYIMLNEVQSSDRAMGQGLITLFTSVGQMTGATLIGIIVAAAVNRLRGYDSSFLLIAIMAYAVMLLSFLLKGRKDEIQNASRVQGGQFSFFFPLLAL
ncbi:MAG: MFS transporter [Bacteroidales bacterium]|nr:MFS transporter [Bacteroidales bacterium]